MKSVGQIYEQEVQDLVQQTEKLRKKYKKAQRAYARLTKKDDTNAAFKAFKDMQDLTEMIGGTIKNIDEYNRLSSTRRDVYGPRYRKQICLYNTGSDPRLAVEFDFFKKEGQANIVELVIALGSMEWFHDAGAVWPWKSMKPFLVTTRCRYIRHLTRGMKSFKVDKILMREMISKINWFRELKKAGYVKNIRDLYEMLKPHIGRYISIAWHNNVLGGCAYDRDRLYIYTSTSDPQRGWVTTISKEAPVLVFENSVYLLQERSYRPIFAKVLAIRCRESKTFPKRPKSFLKYAKRKISHEANYMGFIKQSWERHS